RAEARCGAYSFSIHYPAIRHTPRTLRIMTGQIFVGGAWRAPSLGSTIPVIDPATGETFTEIADGQAADIDAAVHAARQALNGAWGATTALERGRALTRLSQKVLDNFEELAALESRDCGKTLATARSDIRMLARYFEFYGGAADKVHGET